MFNDNPCAGHLVAIMSSLCSVRLLASLCTFSTYHTLIRLPDAILFTSLCTPCADTAETRPSSFSFTHAPGVCNHHNRHPAAFFMGLKAPLESFTYSVSDLHFLTCTEDSTTSLWSPYSLITLALQDGDAAVPGETAARSVQHSDSTARRHLLHLAVQCAHSLRTQRRHVKSW